ncbi:O-antigen ligase family protein [Bradyrhizobium sp. 23]|uniref:O-antigen ligase family protein n=1 Tax=Bradyrhizobium sp. 23 TaxID=2782667 RepID=UPI001FFA457A|nr:O-antigen ligase family protein [Bradyrhizobium sp. 23]MCK1313372.1 O-antigen ligase family protein [Bradyrhizobium sp. 23]
MLLLIFGWLGLSGNSLATGSVLAFLVIGLCSLGFLSRSPFHLSVLDGLFFVILISIVVAGVKYWNFTELKEAALFAVCGILAYVAGRLTSLEKLAALSRYALIASVGVVALTCAATIPELYRVWGVAEKRPIVFGFEHAVNLFAMTLGPLIFGFVYSRADRKIQSWPLMILVYLATTLFVASLVRYTFVVVFVSIGFMMVVSIGMRDRARTWRLAMIMAIVLLGISSGLIVRYESVYNFATAALDEADESSASLREVAFTKTPELILSSSNSGILKRIVNPASGIPVPEQLPPSCRGEVSTYNSVSIRRALYQDAFYLVPRSGFFGLGLDSFKKLTCVKGHQVHNIYLQGLIEAGWLGGAALLALTLFPFLFLPGLIRRTDPAELPPLMFLIATFGFAALLGLAHGTLSRELTFFLTIGAISGGIARWRNISPEKATLKLSGPKCETQFP